MGKNKNKKIETYAYEEPKHLPIIDVNNAIECIFQKLKVAKGVAIAPSLKCPQGCCVTKEN